MWGSNTFVTAGSRAGKYKYGLLASAAAAFGALTSLINPVNAANDIIIGSKEPGSSFYTYAAAIADVLSKHSGKTGKVLSVAGTGVFPPMMENKEADLGLVSIAFWDNRCVHHHAIFDYWPNTRSGFRVQIEGEEPPRPA